MSSKKAQRSNPGNRKTTQLYQCDSLCPADRQGWVHGTFFTVTPRGRWLSSVGIVLPGAGF